MFLFLLLVIRQIIIYNTNCSEKILGFQRVCAPFGRGLGGEAPESPSAEGEIPLAFKNGERGEKCDSISRRSGHDRFSLLQLHSRFISKMCQWHIFDVTLL